MINTKQHPFLCLGVLIGNKAFTINYYKEGFVKWEYAIVIAFTFVIGGYLGSKLSLSLPPQMVRRVFGVIMLLGAIKLISSK